MKDPVARVTPLGIMLLALLREGDMHPYEMMRLLRQREDYRLVTITNGTLYHTVARLERAGLMTEIGVDRDGNRPERTTYALTDAGRDAVDEWVRRELPRIDRPNEFRIALAEAHNLDRAEVLDLLRARRAALRDEHARRVEAGARARARDVPEQFLVEQQRTELLLGADLAWIDELIERLDAHAFGWGIEEIPTDSEHARNYDIDRKAARL